VIFTGTTAQFNGISYSVDYGSYDTFKNCTLRGQLVVNSVFNPNAIPPQIAGHGTFENLTLAGNPAQGLPFVLSSSGPSNSFRNIMVLSGNIQLSGTDTYRNFFYQPPTILIGGIPVNN
jgi:hypothetical protein